MRWQEEGGLDLAEKARRKALKILAEHEPAPLPAEVAARIDAVVDGFGPRREGGRVAGASVSRSPATA